MTEIEEFCKRVYEEVVMNCILSSGNLVPPFVRKEMYNDKYVQFLLLSFDDDQYGDLCIRTEISGGILSSDDKSHIDTTKRLFKKYGCVELVVGDGVREWYESYLVPRMENALVIKEL